MNRALYLPLVALLPLGLVSAQREGPAGQSTPQPSEADAPQLVFRSEVALVRVDAQVTERLSNRTIMGLKKEDFILRENGQEQTIRDFASEEMPVDVILLLDVSGSMRPHVERIARASRTALNVLGPEDRLAILTFDRRARVRLPFKTDRLEVQRELDDIVHNDGFNGGTDINGGLIAAAAYMRKAARKDARRAIIILTDDQTGTGRDVRAMVREMAEADAVLSALLAPVAYDNRRTYPGGGGTTWPGGGGGGLGWPGVILGPGNGPLGGGWPGGGRRRGGGNGPVVLGGAGLKSAGTEEIARQSGGDSMNVNYADSLERTLARIRQRYALFFYLPAEAQSGEERKISVELTDSVRRRYPDAEVRYRRQYASPEGFQSDTAPVVVSESDLEKPAETAGASAQTQAPPTATHEEERTETAKIRRRASVGQGPRNGPLVMLPSAEPDEKSEAAPAKPAEPKTEPASGGWRKLKPGEKP